MSFKYIKKLLLNVNKNCIIIFKKRNYNSSHIARGKLLYLISHKINKTAKSTFRIENNVHIIRNFLG